MADRIIAALAVVVAALSFLWTATHDHDDEPCAESGVEQCLEDACPGWEDCAASGRTDCSSLCDQSALEKCMPDGVGSPGGCCHDCLSADCVACCGVFGGCCGA